MKFKVTLLRAIASAVTLVTPLRWVLYKRISVGSTR